MSAGQSCIYGWKDIAAFLGVSERSVRRWEAERDLPIHRVPGGSRGSVFAIPDELTAWRLGQPGNLAITPQTSAAASSSSARSQSSQPSLEDTRTPDGLSSASPSECDEALTEDLAGAPATIDAASNGDRELGRAAPPMLSRARLVLGATIVGCAAMLYFFTPVAPAGALHVSQPHSKDWPRVNGGAVAYAPSWSFRISTPDRLPAVITVIEGTCGGFEFEDWTGVELCPKLTASTMRLEIARRSGGVRVGDRPPMTLRLEPNVEVLVTLPHPFTVEWIRKDHP